MSDKPIPYALPACARIDAASILRPPSGATVAETAERFRELDNAGGGYSGPWRHAIAPYLVEVMGKPYGWSISRNGTGCACAVGQV